MSRDERNSCRLIVVGLIGALSLLLPPRSADAQTSDARSSNGLRALQGQHEKLHAGFARAVDEIARECDAKGLADAAAQVRRAAGQVEVEVESLSAESLPSRVQPEIPLSLPADERAWRVRLRGAQRDHAKELYLLSRRALHAGFPSYAYRLVREVAHHDPDHTAARRLLGQVRYGDEWTTPFAAAMARRRFVWHERFGWLPKTHVGRYEKGERFFNRRWIGAAQEAEIRRDFNHAWEVRTEHYLVRTNHSLERGVEVAKALEDFYGFFFETFAGFFNTPEQMQTLFEGAAARPRAVPQGQPYVVHYYRTRDEYNARLKSKIPQIAITNGLYLTTDRVAYFFHDDAVENTPTLYHEATHQIFYESLPRDRSIAERRDFWIIEGISCYVESFEHENGRMSLGDPNHARFRAARYRYLVDDYYVPLARFTAMGREAFQTDPNISKNYSQASGLAKFFMEHDGGRYRDALIEHIAQLYRADSRRPRAVESLEELTGVPFAELDRQYGEFLRAEEQTLQRERSSGD